MIPPTHRPLVAAAAWSVPAALLAPVSLPVAAVWTALGMLVALRWRHPLRLAGLLALPAMLLAMPAVGVSPIDVPPGPLRIDGIVRDVVRAPQSDCTWLWFDRDLRVVAIGDVACVAGDRVQLLGYGAEPAVVGERARVRATARTATVTAGPWSGRRACARLRHELERALLRLVPGPNGALLATLVLGRATRADRELTEAHRATGLSHLLAVSGAHAAMLAFLLGLSSRGRHIGASRTRSAIVLMILLVYAALAGADPPVLRAVIAFALATIAARVGRPFGIATGLLAPALVTCWTDPAAMLGPSFTLSYAAVIGLSLALRGRRADGAGERLREAVRASFWATALTAPLTLWFFDQLAPWTIVLTPLCAPLVAAMLLLGLLASTLACVVPDLAWLFGPPLQLLASVYTGIVQAADVLPCTPILAPFRPPTWLLLLAGCAGAGLVVSRPTRRRLLLAIAMVLGTWFVPPLRATAPRFELLAVGHGQAALATTAGGDQVVLDCGSLQGGRRAARQIADRLTRRCIDLLVLSHDDRDHHNGLAALLAAVRVRRALLPSTLADSEAHARLCEHGSTVEVLAAGAHRRPLPDVDVFAPAVPAAASDNDKSLWTSLTIAGTRVLAPGDAQELAIASMLQNRRVDRHDVLLLPHHGRPNHNASRLLAIARPGACLASAAAQDGDTSQGRLARRAGCEVWVTGQHGSIAITPTHTGAAVTSTLPRRLPP